MLRLLRGARAHRGDSRVAVLVDAALARFENGLRSRRLSVRARRWRACRHPRTPSRAAATAAWRLPHTSRCHLAARRVAQSTNLPQQAHRRRECPHRSPTPIRRVESAPPTRIPAPSTHAHTARGRAPHRAERVAGAGQAARRGLLRAQRVFLAPGAHRGRAASRPAHPLARSARGSSRALEDPRIPSAKSSTGRRPRGVCRAGLRDCARWLLTKH